MLPLVIHIELLRHRALVRFRALASSSPMRRRAVHSEADATDIRHIEGRTHERDVTLSVTPLSDKVSQLLIVASVLPGEESDAGRAVDAALPRAEEEPAPCSAEPGKCDAADAADCVEPVG